MTNLVFFFEDRICRQSAHKTVIRLEIAHFNWHNRVMEYFIIKHSSELNSITIIHNHKMIVLKIDFDLITIQMAKIIVVHLFARIKMKHTN